MNQTVDYNLPRFISLIAALAGKTEHGVLISKEKVVSRAVEIEKMLLTLKANDAIDKKKAAVAAERGEQVQQPA